MGAQVFDKHQHPVAADIKRPVLFFQSATWLPSILDGLCSPGA
jgi:hypothetical protein